MLAFFSFDLSEARNPKLASSFLNMTLIRVYYIRKKKWKKKFGLIIFSKAIPKPKFSNRIESKTSTPSVIAWKNSLYNVLPATIHLTL
jgi:hypothetical protein